MITKEKLLEGLHEVIYVEEGMVTTLANFSRVSVKHADDIEEDKKKNIEKLLSKLYRDSSRHKGIIDNIINHVEGSVQDEY